MSEDLRHARKSETADEKKSRLLLTREWRERNCWSPNQLRHNAATEIRAKFGLEAAQMTLGHATADISQIYAERDLRKAAEVMAVVGWIPGDVTTIF
jgi:integrase